MLILLPLVVGIAATFGEGGSYRGAGWIYRGLTEAATDGGGFDLSPTSFIEHGRRRSSLQGQERGQGAFCRRARVVLVEEPPTHADNTVRDLSQEEQAGHGSGQDWDCEFPLVCPYWCFQASRWVCRAFVWLECQTALSISQPYCSRPAPHGRV